MKEPWQATSFWESASKAFIYASNPGNDFEKFMNKFCEINGFIQENEKRTDRSVNKFMEQ